MTGSSPEADAVRRELAAGEGCCAGLNSTRLVLLRAREAGLPSEEIRRLVDESNGTPSSPR